MGVWSYGVFNLAHILGISTLFGSILVLDLRLLGLWRRIALPTITTPTLPLAAVGFTLATLSGICMITANAIDYVGNPFLFIKFPAIALALLNAVAVSFLPAWRNTPTRRGRRDVAGLLACSRERRPHDWVLVTARALPETSGLQ